MKKVLLLLAISVGLSSCQELKRENESLREEVVELKTKNAEKEELLSSFGETMMMIQQNLAEIREREINIQEMSSGAGKERLKTARESVVEDLDAIADRMDQNKKLLDDLNKKLGLYGRETGQLKNLVAKLRADVDERDSSLVALREDLESKNFRIAEISEEMDRIREEKERQLQEKEDELNSAWYVSGTYKNLEEIGIVDKKGGFIGIGRVKTLSDGFNRDAFTNIDKRTFDRLTLDVKKAELMTTHPEGSYRWEENEGRISALVIEDRDKFWGTTKSLVVLTD